MEQSDLLLIVANIWAAASINVIGKKGRYMASWGLFLSLFAVLKELIK